MIVFPMMPSAPLPDSRQLHAAWKCVEARQRRLCDSFLLVSQPDHAHLAGEIAAHFESPAFSALPAAVVESIRLHDEGWGPVDGTAPTLNVQVLSDRPKNFLQFSPNDFIVCWRRSIEGAERLAPVGGVIVSRHFVSIAQLRLNTAHDSEHDREILEEFIVNEAFRQQYLVNTLGSGEAELDYYLRALQFSDVLSLYLCSGVPENVEFPQHFGGRPVTLQRLGRAYVLDPSPFPAPIRVSVKAVPFENGKLGRNQVELWWELR